MRTTPAENTEIGRRIAEKLNAATGPVALLFPLQGISALDRPGKPFYSADADQALLNAFTAGCGPGVQIKALDCHINDDAFAKTAVDTLLSFLTHQEVESSHA